MSDPLKRRNFIRSLAIAGFSVAISDPLQASAYFPGRNEQEIANEFFTVSFDSDKGLFNIYSENRSPLLPGGTACVNLVSGKHLLSARQFHHSIKITSFKDLLGSGKRLTVYSTDRKKELELQIQFSIYDQLEAVTLELICKNISKHELTVLSLEPARAIQEEGGTLNMTGVSKCITNGEMFYDTGTIHEFGKNDQTNPADASKGVKLINKSLQGSGETVHSWWNAGLFSGYDKKGLVLGYLDNNSGLGNLLISKTAEDRLSFVAETAYAPQLILKPGASISSNRFMINRGVSTYAALEIYADAMGTVNNARINSIVNGWCSWFYTLAQVSENEVVANAVFAAEHLKNFGLEYIQVDEGYQRSHGDWEGNKRFPHGMQWLAQKIRSLGFKAGIWISPYVVTSLTDVVKEHPEWLVKNPDGSLQRIGNWDEGTEPPAEEDPKRYCLDITHPAAANWLHQLIDTIANDWGYEMIKIDFVAWSILAARRYHDPTATSAQVYRKGLEIMRKAAGDHCHILECGPGATTVGLIDSMRIEADVNYGFSESAWTTYFTHPACSASAAGKRYYFHKRTWVNDVDHIVMDLLNHQQSQAAATLIAISGGNMVSGDRLIQLEPYKLEILKKITPSLGRAAVPIDLFDQDIQTGFVLKVRKPFGLWTILALFNPDLVNPLKKKFPLNRLWLRPEKTYLAFDFWEQRFFGEIKGEISTIIQPGSVRLLAIHEKTGKPQLLSTDRHVMQGAIELESVNWNDQARILSGVSIGPLHSAHNLFVYVPEDHPWSWNGNALYQDHDNYSLKLMDNHIIQVHLDFEKSEKLNWEINFDQFFKK